MSWLNNYPCGIEVNNIPYVCQKKITQTSLNTSLLNNLISQGSIIESFTNNNSINIIILIIIILIFFLYLYNI